MVVQTCLLVECGSATRLRHTAFIWALQSLGVDDLILVSAIGSLKKPALNAHKNPLTDCLVDALEVAISDGGAIEASAGEGA